MAKKHKMEYVWTDKKRTLFGLPLSFTRYYLTKTKFVCRTGIFNLEEDEIDIYKITDKKLILSFWQRMFGCGTIRLYSRDTDTPKKDIISIKRPREVSELFDKYINEHRDRYGIRGRDMIGATHGGPPPDFDHIGQGDMDFDYPDHDGYDDHYGD